MFRILLSVLLISPLLSSAQNTSVLFIGNSYTGVNDLPNMFRQLALAAGDTVYVDSNTPGGSTFEGHSTNAMTLAKIGDRNWDFVVLQEQSQRPSFPPTQVASEVYPFAAILVDSINSNHECTEPIFYMTWGRRSGDQANCQFYEPLCTYNGMQERLRESYLEMGIDNNARVAPCGAAWSRMETTDSLFFAELYANDGSHPSLLGSYLNACVFYASVFHKTPVGINWYSSLDQADAQVLQALAQEVVMDSLDNWNSLVNLPQIMIDHIDSGLNVSFTNNSTNAASSLWDFGDGSISSEWDPDHAYSDAGDYEVTYQTDNGCGDIDSDTINISLLNTGTIRNGESPFIVRTLGNGRFEFEKGFTEYSEVKVFDCTGRLLGSHSFNKPTINIDLSEHGSGIYPVRLESVSGAQKWMKLIR